MLDNDTFIEKLEKQIEDLYPIIDKLMDNSSVYYHDSNGDHGSYFSIGAPIYHYSKKDQKTQIIAKQNYLKFLDNIELLLNKSNANTLRNIKNSQKHILNFIEQNNAPASIEGGKLSFRKQMQVFKDFLNLFKKDEINTIIIPDTNAIIQYPDPISYQKLIGSTFSFLVLPTVLSELDKLKTMHRDTDFKEKVKSIIKRLKGYRQQGNVLQGVSVHKTITVKMVATEPNFETTLKWLDPKNEDDRIIANALEIQIENPSDKVILFTSDINLQNKAQMANLTFADTDDLE